MQISTSILNATDRIETIKKLNSTNTKYIHIDIMDGLFVADKQLNKIEEINKISLTSKNKLDIHLMVENPKEYILKLNNMNIEYITFHVEIEKNKKELIQLIKNNGYKVGIAIKPTTNINKLIPYLDNINLILIMSVEPGKGGQKFIPTTINKIKKVKEIIKSRDIKIEVDGGINENTIKLLKDTDISVVGTYIINSNDYNKTINKLINN